MTETLWPSSDNRVAKWLPTRPQPTTMMFMTRPLVYCTVITSQPMYGRRTSGTVMVPSAFW